MFEWFDDIFNLYWDTQETNTYKLNDKQLRTRDLVLYMLARTQQIFVWEGLPDTIPSHNLETLLQLHGNVCVTDVTETPEGVTPGLYALFGGLGGVPNAYYEPTLYTVSNPYLNYSKSLMIDRECIRLRNDKYGIGLLPMFTKYGAMMNENEISMNMVSINYRIDNLISADDDRTFESAKDFLNGIVDGQFGAISSTEFFEGIRNDKTSTGSRTIKDLIEYEQYLKASWYNEIGLNSNYNMKRERIVSSEAEMTDDALIPLVDNMLSWRLKGIEELKEMYGDKYDLSNLTVRLNRIWDLDKMYFDMLPESEAHPEESEQIEEQLEDLQNEFEYDNEETTEGPEEINTADSTTESELENELDELEETPTPVPTPIEETEESENATVDINIDINLSTNDEESSEEVSENTQEDNDNDNEETDD